MNSAHNTAPLLPLATVLGAFHLDTLREVFAANSALGAFDAERFESGPVADSLQLLHDLGLVEAAPRPTIPFNLRPTDKAYEAFTLHFQGSQYVEPRHAFDAELRAL